MLHSLLGAGPSGYLQGHDGPAYDVKFYGDDEDALLLRFDSGLLVSFLLVFENRNIVNVDSFGS